MRHKMAGKVNAMQTAPFTSRARMTRTVIWMMLAMLAAQAFLPALSMAAAGGLDLSTTPAESWIPSNTPYAAGSTDLASSAPGERIGGCFYPATISKLDGTTVPSNFPKANQPMKQEDARDLAYRLGFVTSLYTTGALSNDPNDSGYHTGTNLQPDKLKELASMPHSDDDKVKNSSSGDIAPADFQGQYGWFKDQLQRIHDEAPGGLGRLVLVPANDASGVAASIAMRNVPAACLPTVSVNMIQSADLKTFILHPFQFMRSLLTNVWASIAAFLYNLFSPMVWKLGFFTPHVERGETFVDVMRWDAQCFNPVAGAGSKTTACTNSALGFDTANIDTNHIENVAWVRASKVVRLLVTSTYFLIIAWSALVHVARPGRQSSWNLYTKLPQVILATFIVLLAPPAIGIGITVSNQFTTAAFNGGLGGCGQASGLTSCSVESQTNSVISNSGSLVNVSENHGVANKAAAWLGGFWAGPMEVRLMAMTITGYMLAILAIYSMLRQLGLVLLIITLPVAATALIDQRWHGAFRAWFKLLIACLMAPPLIAVVGAVGFMINPLNQGDLSQLTFMSRIFGLALFCVTIYAMSMVMVGLRKWAVGGGNSSIAGKMWSKAGKGMTAGRLKRSLSQSPLNRPIGAAAGRIGGATGLSNGSERALSRATGRSNSVQTSVQNMGGSGAGAAASARGKAAGMLGQAASVATTGKLSSDQAATAAALGGGAVAASAFASAGAGGRGGNAATKASDRTNADAAVVRVQQLDSQGNIVNAGKGLGEDGTLSVANLTAHNAHLAGKVQGAGTPKTAAQVTPAAAGSRSTGGGRLAFVKAPVRAVRSMDNKLQGASVSSMAGADGRMRPGAKTPSTAMPKQGKVSTATNFAKARPASGDSNDKLGAVQTGGWSGQPRTAGMSPASEIQAIDSFKKMEQAARSVTGAVGEVVRKPGYSGEVDSQKLYTAIQEALKHHPGRSSSTTTR
jgi:hypothetical protein